jgi:hypothetical protein
MVTDVAAPPPSVGHVPISAAQPVAFTIGGVRKPLHAMPHAPILYDLKSSSTFLVHTTQRIDCLAGLRVQAVGAIFRRIARALLIGSSMSFFTISLSGYLSV